MKKIEKGIYVLSIVIVAAAALLFAPLLFGIRPYVVLSGSMAPAVRTGSLAYVDKNAEPDALSVGDVIAFRQGDNVVTHRIVAQSEEGYITKGDANPRADGLRVPREEVVGRIAFSVPYLGYAVARMQSPYVIVFSVIIFAAYLVYSILSDIKEFKEEQKHEEIQNDDCGHGAEPGLPFGSGFRLSDGRNRSGDKGVYGG